MLSLGQLGRALCGRCQHRGQSSAHPSQLGADSLYVAAAALERAKTLQALARFDEARALAGSLQAAFLRHGRGDLFAETLLIRHAAARGQRQFHTDQAMPAADARWRDYAFGVARPLIVTAEARPPASMLALSLAMALTLLPAAWFMRLVARAF